MFSWSPEMVNREMERFSVIQPPSKVNEKKRTMRVLIDSRDRNHLTHPLPSHYRYDFIQDTPQNVENIELLSANVPMSQYKIHSNNNNLNFSLSVPLWDPSENEYIFSGIFNLKVPIGDYSEEQLAAVLQEEFRKHDANLSTMTVTYDALKGHFRFQVPSTFPFPIVSFIARGDDTMYGANEAIEVPMRDENNAIVYDAQGQMRTQLVYENNIQSNYRKGTILKSLGFGLKQTSTMLRTNFSTHVLDDGAGKSVIVYPAIFDNDGDLIEANIQSGDSIRIFDYTNPRLPISVGTTYLVDTIDVTQAKSSGLIFVTLGGALTLASPSTMLRIATTYLKSEFKSEIVSEPYIVLRIERGGNVLSNNRAIHKSFAIVNKMTAPYTNLHVYDLMYEKKFNPIIPTLNSITFKFLNRDGTLYDFQNQDHYLEVLITMNSQNTKYSI